MPVPNELSSTEIQRPRQAFRLIGGFFAQLTGFPNKHLASDPREPKIRESQPARQKSVSNPTADFRPTQSSSQRESRTPVRLRVGDYAQSNVSREHRGTKARFPDSHPVTSLRFSCGLGIPTLAVFAGQIFIGVRQVGDLLGRAVVEQFIARPQCNRIQVHGL